MKKTILLIEDNPDLRETMAEQASLLGFNVLEASNGQTALHYLKNSSVDLILSDVRMPEMDGIEFLKTFRQQNQTTPVYIMTGLDEVNEYQVYLFQGNGLFYKPISPEVFISFLEKFQ